MASKIYTINGLAYVDLLESTAKLIKDTIQVTGQTTMPESQQSIDNRNYKLSTRNGANAYMIPTEEDKVYLNFIPQKTYVPDMSYNNMIIPEFEYFVEDIIPLPDPYILADGFFYRCASDTPKSKESHTYYLMVDGVAKQIPNYKTLEVMLAERGQNLLSVRILEKNQCEDIIKDNSGIEDLSGSWTKDFEDVTNIDALKKMEDSAKDAGAIADGAKGEVQKQIDAVLAQAAASKAEAEAEKAKAEAEKAKADAAKKEAEAAIAEAKQKEAEAEEKKAEYESKT